MKNIKKFLLSPMLLGCMLSVDIAAGDFELFMSGEECISYFDDADDDSEEIFFDEQMRAEQLADLTLADFLDNDSTRAGSGLLLSSGELRTFPYIGGLSDDQLNDHQTVSRENIEMLYDFPVSISDSFSNFETIEENDAEIEMILNTPLPTLSVDAQTSSSSQSDEPSGQPVSRKRQQRISPSESRKTYPCEGCDKIFQTQTGLRLHKKNVHEEEKHQCSSCEKSFTRKAILFEHIENMHKKIRWQCPLCASSYTKKFRLNTHMRDYHPEASGSNKRQRSRGLDVHGFEKSIIDSSSSLTNDQMSTELSDDQEVSQENIEMLADFPVPMPDSFGSETVEERITTMPNDLESAMISDVAPRLTACVASSSQVSSEPILLEGTQAISSSLESCKTYPCERCDKIFHSQQGLGVHTKSVHAVGNQCPVCEKSFARKGHLNLHIKTVHERVRDYACNQCEKSFSWKSNLSRHIESAHKKIRLQCPLCVKSVTDKSYLNRHMRDHHPEVSGSNKRQRSRGLDVHDNRPDIVFEKPITDFSESLNEVEKDMILDASLPTLAVGIPASSSHEPYVQDENRQDTQATVDSLISIDSRSIIPDDHQDSYQDDTAMPDSPVSNELSEVIQESSLLLAKTTSRSTASYEKEMLPDTSLPIVIVREKARDYVCNRCEKSFTKQFNLLRHIQSVHKKMRNQCALCDAIHFFYRRDLIKHMRDKHPGVIVRGKNIEVGELDVQDNRQDIGIEGNDIEKEMLPDTSIPTLTAGLIAGSSEPSASRKTYSCERCNKIFNSKPALLYHRKSVHNEGARHQCPSCDQNFIQKGDLKQHIMSIHEGVKYQCRVCEKNFTQKGHFNVHIKTAHGEARDYACNLCEKSFTTQSNLSRHIESVHKKIRLQCSLCDTNYSDRSDLAKHMRDKHPEQAGANKRQRRRGVDVHDERGDL